MPKYCNFMSGVPELLIRCIEEQLWIKAQRRWMSPYDWAWKFGIVYHGLGWEPELGNPHHLITQARADIASGNPLTFPLHTDPLTAVRLSGVEGGAYSEGGVEAPTTARTILALENFEKRVQAYYSSDADHRLRKSVETGIWH